ncbi:MAG: EAL domain-containing protein [Burkholderiaceae bacterium]|nr:EAL domain-containing protein [Burkholderiaceae bacterium]
MSVSTTWSLRRLLYLLTACSVLPLGLLLAYNTGYQYRQDQQAARAEALRLAQQSADTVEAFIRDARVVLQTLSARPAMRAGLAPRGTCDPIFASFKQFYPQLSNISLSNPQGYLICSALPQPDNKPLPVAHMQWFREVYERQDFVVGSMLYGPINRNWISVLAEPVRDEQGRMVGAVQTPIDLLKFRLLPGVEKLPDGVLVGLIDPQGRVVARSRDAPQWVGRELKGLSPIIDRVLVERQGTAESVGVEGIAHFYGYTPVAGTEWIAISGIPARTALQHARRSLLTSLLAGGTILVLVLWLALHLSQRISGPILAVSAAARRARDGDLDVRAPSEGPREVVAVATQFNAMLEAIQHSQDRLQSSEERLTLALEGAHLAIWDLDVARGRVLHTETWAELLAEPQVPLDNTVPALLRRVPSPDRQQLYRVASALLDDPQRNDFLLEHRVRRSDGTLLWLATQGRVTARDHAGRAIRLLGTHRDVTERRLRDEEIHRLAFFDPLTGLPNRRLLAKELAQALARARRSGRYGACFFIDLDQFKSVNDARGHDLGDQLLQAVARRLQDQVREGDTVVRMGGDEFVVLMTNLADTEEGAARAAHAAGEKIRHALEQPYPLDLQHYASSASLGISLLPQEGQTPDDVVREADTAMYRAKSLGRNQLAFYRPEMQAEIEQQLNFEHDLSQAIQLDQLSLHLQTQYDLQGRPRGAELLLRWLHPQRGPVPPADFIRVAEQTGLIVRLGDWVIDEACRLLGVLGATGWTLPLSINVSPRQFRQDNFVESVTATLRAHDTRGENLVFEITESLLVGDVNETVERIQRLQALGIRFSIDDFGTGYSSLSYLKRLPLHELKIDKSFIRDIPQDNDDVEIVHMIMSLARQLRLEVVAEGVETAEQLEWLRQRGCDRVQGYLMERPMPLAQWLQHPRQR